MGDSRRFRKQKDGSEEQNERDCSEMSRTSCTRRTVPMPLQNYNLGAKTEQNEIGQKLF